MKANDSDIERRILKFFKDRPQVQRKSVDYLFSEDVDAKAYCELLLLNEPMFIDVYNVVRSLVKGVKLKQCKTCGKTLPFGKVGNYCSAKCRNGDKDKINRQVASFKKTIASQPDRDEILAEARKTNVHR